MDRFFNVHTHTFTIRATHSRIHILIEVLRSPVGATIFMWVLRRLWFIKSRQRLAAFATIGRKNSQIEIYEHVRAFYPAGTRFVVLPMDMDYLAPGTPPQPYEEQLRELLDLTGHEAYRDEIFPFFAVDPRRPGVLELLKEYVEKHAFRGIKLYPPLGFYPCDPRLTEIYRYAEERSLPVLSHCSRGGVYFKGPITEAMRIHPRSGQRVDEERRKQFTEHFTDPRHFEVVLEEHPDLRVCLAHYGGGEEWRRHMSDPWTTGEEMTWLGAINDMLRKHRNLYVDVSATVADRRTHGLMKILIEDPAIGGRILYGSDYYMIQREVTEREFSIDLRAFIGERNFERIAIENPERFLG